MSLFDNLSKTEFDDAFSDLIKLMVNKSKNANEKEYNDGVDNLLDNILKKVDEDPTELLNKNFKYKIVENIKKWNTPFGVSFFSKKIRNVKHWFYEYDDDIDDPVLKPIYTIGAIMGKDVINAVDKLIKDHELLRKKPESIKILEKLTGNKAFRMRDKLGSWHIHEYKKYSLFNNPLNIQFIYTNSADNFEILIHSENVPREYIDLTDVIELLKEHKFVNSNNREAEIMDIINDFVLNNKEG